MCSNSLDFVPNCSPKHTAESPQNPANFGFSLWVQLGFISVDMTKHPDKMGLFQLTGSGYDPFLQGIQQRETEAAG